MNKRIFIIIITVLSFLSHAGVGDSAGGSSSKTLQQLKKEGDYFINVPIFKFDAPYWINIFEFCQEEEDTVRSIVELDNGEAKKEYYRRSMYDDYGNQIIFERYEIPVKEKVIKRTRQAGFEVKGGKTLYLQEYEIKKCFDVDDN